MPMFREENLEEILDFVRNHAFAMVTAAGVDGKVYATHVPLLVSEQDGKVRLRGHVMRKTKYWIAFHEAKEVLVAFTGPDAPVLASWRENKEFGGTWNYMAVHMRGSLTFLPQAELVNILRDLKDSYETDPTAKFESLPPAYVPSLIDAIEGFEIDVAAVEAVFKLSQNQNEADFDNIVEQLRIKGGESALVAQEMASRRTKLLSGRHKV